ncbi:MAG TPA: hypothetical protein DD640_00520, partial [Clostridiales bacterium]|nr:hypothetical protein [Clostridiales bacterium]
MSLTKIITADERYLTFPVQNGAPKSWVSLHIKGDLVREFEIELTDGQPDFWVFCDLDQWIGQELTIRIDNFTGNASILEQIRPSRDRQGAKDFYHEQLRPQFHFSSRRGWLNDPNGLLYDQGEYHLFY